MTVIEVIIDRYKRMHKDCLLIITVGHDHNVGHVRDFIVNPENVGLLYAKCSSFEAVYNAADRIEKIEIRL